MKKIVLFLFLFLTGFLLSRDAYAADSTNCTLTINEQPYNQPLVNPDELRFDFDFSDSEAAKNFGIYKFNFSFPLTTSGEPEATIDGYHALYTAKKGTKNYLLFTIAPHKVELIHKDSKTEICGSKTFEIVSDFSPPPCEIKTNPPVPNWQDENIKIEIGKLLRGKYELRLISDKSRFPDRKKSFSSKKGKIVWDDIGNLPEGWVFVEVYSISQNIGGLLSLSCKDSFYVLGADGVIPPPPPKDRDDEEVHEICEIIKEPDANKECQDCFDEGNAWTALGCLPTNDPQQFIGWLLKFLIGIGGGIAFVLMLIGAFQVLTSSGNPEKIQSGKQMITSAIAGLLLIIFSLFLLQLIGVQILEIPRFGV